MKPAALFALLALLPAACVSPLRSDAPALAPASDNYLLLWSGIPQLWGMTASAVIVADGLAVTNRHVVEASSHWSAESAGRGMVGVEVVALSDRMDLAVIAVPRGQGRPLALGAPAAGQEVWMMGAPSALALGTGPVARGTLLRPDAWSCASAACDHRQHGLMLAAPVTQGYSGGPILDSGGRLIGITQGVFTALFDEGGNPVASALPHAFGYPIAAVMAETRRLLGETQVAAGEAPDWLVAD